MSRPVAARLVAATVPMVAAAVMVALAPPDRLVPAWRAGLHAHDGGTALLLATMAVAAWALVGWITLGVLVAALGTAPGVLGTAARRTSQRVTPAVLRSVLSGGTAVGLALTPLLPVAAHAAPPCAPSTSAAGLPSLDRPVAACPTPAPARTTSTPMPPTATSAAPTPPPSAATTRPPAAAPRQSSHAALPKRLPAGLTRVVTSGDTLWSLARTELRGAGLPATDAAIAQRWPAWWQANRAEIGPNPDLLHPGEVLHAPTAPTRQEIS